MRSSWTYRQLMYSSISPLSDETQQESMGNRQLPFDFQKVVCVYLPYPNPSSNQVPTPFLIRRSDVYLHLSKSYTEHILTSTIYTTGLLSFFHILVPQQLVNQWVRFMPHQNRWAISKTSNVQVVDWLHPSRWDPGPWLVFPGFGAFFQPTGRAKLHDFSI